MRGGGAEQWPDGSSSAAIFTAAVQTDSLAAGLRMMMVGERGGNGWEGRGGEGMKARGGDGALVGRTTHRTTPPHSTHTHTHPSERQTTL